MGIDINEAREQLCILEECVNNPELILTKLFKNKVSGTNFLRQIRINNKYVFDCLLEYLETLPIFDNCELKCSSYDLNIYMDAIKYRSNEEFYSPDLILIINMDDKTYSICDDSLKSYRRIINKEYKYEPKELSDFWKKFDNLTLSKRFKNAFCSLSSNKKLHVRISDFFFYLFVSKRTVNKKLDNEKRKIENINENDLKYYNLNIKRQSFYKEVFPAFERKVMNKQKEIVEYLISLGYKEKKIK